MDTESPCPCGSGLSYADCCGRFISAGQQAETAEQLMRSRFTAFARAEWDYLQRTRHPDFRTPSGAAELASNSQHISWQRLDIISVRGGRDDRRGTVEFKAWYQQDGELQVLHERSRFVRSGGQWLYTDGALDPVQHRPAEAAAKVGRNAPCPCGSGKKYKHCCG